MFDPSAVFYMEKLAAGPESADVVDIRLPAKENIRRVAKAKKIEVQDVTVCILDRPRHDVAGRTRSATPELASSSSPTATSPAPSWPCREDTGVDLLLGIGGTPEGIISAVAIKCLGGVIQGRLWPSDDDERQKAIDAGHDLSAVLSTDELVSSDNCFFAATGVTDGELLHGVRFHSAGATTQTLVMRSKSGTIRFMESDHRLGKLRKYAAVQF